MLDDDRDNEISMARGIEVGCHKLPRQLSKILLPLFKELEALE